MSTAVRPISPRLDDAVVFNAPPEKSAKSRPLKSPQSSRSEPRSPEKSTRPLHFIAETLEKQGAHLVGCARRLGLSTTEAAEQTRPDADLKLSQLYAWRAALDVPLAELLPLEDVVPDPIRNRALLLRTMKTARQLQELSRGSRLERVAESLVEQLIELMPELAATPAWPSVGQSREPRDVGVAARRVDSEFSRFIEDRS